MSFETNVQNLATRVATECKSLRTLLNGNQPNLNALTTTAKGNLVLAINELQAEIASIEAGGVAPATETTAGIVELATTTEAVAGVDTQRAVTPAGAAAVIANLIGAAPADLNEWAEIVARIQASDSDIDGVLTSLQGKQDKDPTLTALAAVTVAANDLIYATGPDAFAVFTTTAFGRDLLASANAAAARTTIDVYSKAEIGDVNANFVTTFEAGLV